MEMVDLPFALEGVFVSEEELVVNGSVNDGVVTDGTMYFEKKVH